MKFPIERMTVRAYRIPTDMPESDGTLAWDSTTMALAEIEAGNIAGIGYSYADRSAATLMDNMLRPIVEGRDAFDIPAIWQSMNEAVRNCGRPGIAAAAISAVDIALWDLKAKLLDAPLVELLGSCRPEIELYGSGGFTSYTHEQLCRQLSDWAKAGFRSVKMKIGRNPHEDVERVRAAREAIGPDAELFVDANGAYSTKVAMAFAESFADLNVRWFEEPVSSDDLEGLRLLRDRAPAGMEIAAGEYGYDSFYFRRMLERNAVDVLQADATRCGGITGFLKAAALCEAFSIPLSAHTAPAIHLHPCCTAPIVRNLEYFHDHVRIESMFFEGVALPQKGMLAPDRSRPGLGIALKHSDAEAYAI